MKQRPQAYSSAAKWLHLVMAVIILSIIPAGLAMTRMGEGPVQDRLFSLHAAFGFTILILAIVRVWVRAAWGAPAPAASLTPFERIASTAAHHLLYVLIVAMPLLGWLGKSAYGAQISWFGLFDVPAILPKNEDLSKVLFKAHDLGGYLIIAVLVAHIGGALMHAFIKQDGVAGRMLPP